MKARAIQIRTCQFSPRIGSLFIAVFLMATGLMGAATAAPKDRTPSKPNAAGEQTGDWLDTQEGQEAQAIMDRALRGEIDDREFERLRAEWRAKWVDGKGAPSLPVPATPNVKLRK